MRLSSIVFKPNSWRADKLLIVLACYLEDSLLLQWNLEMNQVTVSVFAKFRAFGLCSKANRTANHRFDSALHVLQL